jgi:NADH:ubiquinone oxidoreductase subunit E
MSEKIKVTICTGTTCYVLGGAQLLVIEDSLPESLREQVSVEGSMCLEFCKHSKEGKAPFVLVDGELIYEATVPKVIDAIKKRCEP